MILLLYNITMSFLLKRSIYTNIYLRKYIRFQKGNAFRFTQCAQNRTERRAINFLFRHSPFVFLFPRYVFTRIRRAGKTIVGQRVAQCEFSRANTISTAARPTGKEDRSYRGIAADVYRELKGSKGDGDVFRGMTENLRQLEYFALHPCVFSCPLAIRFSNDRSACMYARICSTNSHRDIYKLGNI